MYKETVKPGSRKDSLGALISSTDDDGNHLTDLQLLSNAFLLYIAGTETVSNAATFTIYELAKQPHIAARLAQELSVFQSVKEFETVKLERSPLLNAVIREGVRLYSPVGGPGGREAPHEGVMSGYYIPGGVSFLSLWLSLNCRLPCLVSHTPFVVMRLYIMNPFSSNRKGI